ncbi:sensor histidine kinase [Candidatus Tisiphia endosymbiont of Nemotelus uliginosus]|uniref:sensor histidine kinase n=1 Tax=Candidatus Tisiphia endosymbiont of Nemotelus uliginosus TaxID=3077926 RepID=UPI0035C8DCFE
MASDIKNQQQNELTNEKNNNSTSEDATKTSNETNNIDNDISLELEQVKKKLKLANLVHQDFIKNVSLSIKTSCIGIWSGALVLYEVENDPSKKQSIANITNCAKELINYSGDILDFAKSHSSLTATKALAPHILQKIDPKKLVNRVITKLIPSANYKGIKLVANFQHDLADVVIADSYRLEAILDQLVSNAINFTEKGSIIITTNFFAAPTFELENIYNENNIKNTRAKEDILQFIVHDTGIGMSKDQQQYLYKQLNNLDSSTSKDSAEEVDLGLGLNLVKQFIFELNSKINVNSHQGKSTTFTLQIPVKLPLVKDIIEDMINNIANRRL